MPTSQAGVNTLKTTFIENCCLTAACTLYAFDRCVVFDQEVELMWRRKMSVAIAIYVLMHVSVLAILCTTVALLIIQDCERFDLAYNVCQLDSLKLVVFSGLVLGVTVICSKIVFRWLIGAVSALRVYAINGRTKALPLAIIFLFLMYTVYDFYNASSLYKLPAPPPIGCILLTSMRPEVQHGLKIAGLVCAAVAEALVLSATWSATYKARKATDSMRMSVSGMLLRDGTVYFGVIAVLLVVVAVLELTVTTVSITTLTYVLQTICISRLYLNLRRAASGSDTLTTSASNMENFRFSRFLGPLDGSLVFASDHYGNEQADTDSISSTNDEGAKYEGIVMSNMTESMSTSETKVVTRREVWEVDVRAA